MEIWDVVLSIIHFHVDILYLHEVVAPLDKELIRTSPSLAVEAL